MTKKRNIIRFEDVRDRIVEVRGQKCILDFAVAELYGVETKRINEAVKNNPRKFPDGWVFELEKEEFDNLRSKISTTNVADNQRLEDLRSKKPPQNFLARGAEHYPRPSRSVVSKFRSA